MTRRALVPGTADAPMFEEQYHLPVVDGSMPDWQSGRTIPITQLTEPEIDELVSDIVKWHAHVCGEVIHMMQMVAIRRGELRHQRLTDADKLLAGIDAALADGTLGTVK